MKRGDVCQLCRGEETERIRSRWAVRGDFEFADNRGIVVAAVGEGSLFRLFRSDLEIKGSNPWLVENNLARVFESDAPNFHFDDGALLSETRHDPLDVFDSGDSAGGD